MNKTLSSLETAQRLGVTDARVRQLIAERALKAEKLGATGASNRRRSTSTNAARRRRTASKRLR